MVVICQSKKERFYGMKKRHLENNKLYYIEQELSTTGEEIELYTWEDACDLVKNCHALQPEERFVIREFKPA